MSTNYYNAFVAKLKEIFMMDHAELDFGIYRIMNQKRSDIMQFLEHDLLPQVTTVLNEAGAGDAAPITARMKEIEAQLGNSVETLPETIPMVSEYKQLKAKLEQAADTAALQNDVFSHLVTFFSRYYDNGDFVSKRRYKDNTYAIPYNGEEVKLHWANADQYYIKSSEYFRDYSFVLPASRRKVHFVLKDASTEQNNNKAANNMERRFALFASTSSASDGEPFLEVNDDGLNIYFTYELMPKATKQDALLAEALAAIRPAVPEAFAELLTTKAPTAKDANRTLLEKHLTDYTAKNSFDYFIHKDLGGFLRRELDFYIKNEVMHLDDLDAAHIAGQLTMIKAIKQVGDKIIRMLAQLEDFQKRLWLKKKFVVQSDYCITLDRVPETLYEEIAANDRQREEWVRLFAIDEIKGDMLAEAYSVPLSVEFLRQNPFLVLDTAFFPATFKHKLIASMENIDEQCNGLLINSENFQAIRCISAKNGNGISTVYIDPPFNLNSSADYPYSTNYKDSTWLSLLHNRLYECKKLLKPNALIFVRCDYHGNHFVRHVLENLGFEYKSEILVGRSRNEAGSTKMDVTHEFLYLYTFPGMSVDKYQIKRSVAEIKWTGFLMAGERNPPQRTFFGKTIFPPQGQHFSLVQEKVDKLLSEYHLRLKCKNCGALYYKDDSYEQLSRNMKKDCNKFKFYDIYDTTRFYGVNCLDTCCNCGCEQFTVQYLGAPDEFVNDNWLDISSYSRNWNFQTENSEELLERVIKFTKEKDLVIDFFGGSCTTTAVANKMGRKWVGVEMGRQYYDVDLPRMKKVLSGEQSGVTRNYDKKPSGYFKQIRLEQYEDTLNNLEVKQRQTAISTNEGFRESYMLSYMLDTETKDSLLNLKMFENPFAMTLKTTKDNELVETPVDMVETFNYLIGLEVETEGWYRDGNICVVIGRTHRDKLRTLVIWRNCNEIGNEALNEFFRRMDFRTHDSEFDVIYVNGDNTLPNLRRDDENWKVVLTEEEFAKRMFEKE